MAGKFGALLHFPYSENICHCSSIMIVLTFLLLQTEVDYLGQLHHKNLVKLIGYCSDGDNRLLVYEFMPKGSLENHLFRSMCFISMALLCEVPVITFLVIPFNNAIFLLFRRR